MKRKTETPTDDGARGRERTTLKMETATHTWGYGGMPIVEVDQHLVHARLE